MGGESVTIIIDIKWLSWGIALSKLNPDLCVKGGWVRLVKGYSTFKERSDGGQEGKDTLVPQKIIGGNFVYMLAKIMYSKGDKILKSPIDYTHMYGDSLTHVTDSQENI